MSGYCYCADSQGRELAETGKHVPLRASVSLPGKQKEQPGCPGSGRGYSLHRPSREVL